MRLHQGPIAAPKRRKHAEIPQAEAADMAQLDENLATVDDPELRRALREFGESVLARSKSKDDS